MVDDTPRAKQGGLIRRGYAWMMEKATGPQAL